MGSTNPNRFLPSQWFKAATRQIAHVPRQHDNKKVETNSTSYQPHNYFLRSQKTRYPGAYSKRYFQTSSQKNKKPYAYSTNVMSEQSTSIVSNSKNKTFQDLKKYSSNHLYQFSSHDNLEKCSNPCSNFEKPKSASKLTTQVEQASSIDCQCHENVQFLKNGPDNSGKLACLK